MIPGWAALRGAVSALVLLGFVARLVLPFGANAAIERAAFETLLAGAVCSASGQPAPDEQGEPSLADAGHCPLCRLPEADDHPGPAPRAIGAPRWITAPMVAATADPTPRRPPPRGQPPARAPPAFPTLG